MIAAGMLVGMRVSISMLVGSIVNYCILIPYVVTLPDWADNGKFLGHVETIFEDNGDVALVKVMRWSLWFGTALMVSSGITSFAMGWRTIVRAFKGLGSKVAGNADMDAIEVP